MCFSTEGSFVIGTALTVTGALCVDRSARTDKKFILFALIPLFFGIQQITEGFVWIGLLRNISWMTNFFSHVFVFFSFSFWPVYVPVAVYLVEKYENKMTKRILMVTMFFGVGAGLTAFFLLMPGYIPLVTKIVGHSISYDTPSLGILKVVFTSMYFFAVIPPFLIISDIRFKRFGFLLLFFAIVSQVIFSYAFVSVWCFFAGLLSFYIASVVYRLK